MQKSLQKSHSLQSKTKNEWRNPSSQLIEISKINKRTMGKDIFYYTPKHIFTEPQGKIFHPCDWSIQDFEIGRHLGKGKYGHVYLARQRKTKAIVAIKVITKKQIVNSDIVFQLRRQIEIHSHLKHPNILAMHGFFYDEKRIYILLDYAPYGELYKLLQSQGYFSQEQAAHYIYQMIQALKYIHKHKIIHRDIKPENILLSINDEIKLTDFGWSVHVSDPTKRRRTYCGTPDYICPEIAFQRQYDYRLDLWCLGVLTYEFTAGSAPFSDSDGRRQLIKKIKEVEYKCPQHFSAELKHFIGSLLIVKSEDRMTLEDAEKHPWIQKYYLDLVKSRENQKEKQKYNQQQKDVEI